MAPERRVLVDKAHWRRNGDQGHPSPGTCPSSGGSSWLGRAQGREQGSHFTVMLEPWRGRYSLFNHRQIRVPLWPENSLIGTGEIGSGSGEPLRY